MSERETVPGAEQSASVHAERRAFVRLASDLSVCARPNKRGHGFRRRRSILSGFSVNSEILEFRPWPAFLAISRLVIL